MDRLTCITPQPCPAHPVQVNWTIKQPHRSIIRLTMPPSLDESTHLEALKLKRAKVQLWARAVLWYRLMPLFLVKGGGWADAD